MLTDELRPKFWEDVVGQDINVDILKSIVREPEKAPKTLIFAGTFGSGKSSSAKVFARTLNNITDPDYDLTSSQYYREFDANQFGNVRMIQAVKDDFYSYLDVWRVIVLEEFHRTSPEAQNALLLSLEEAIEGIFFVICTTEINRLLPTVRSRALELFFNRVPPEIIIEHLGKVEKKLGKNIPDNVKRIIAYRSNGHMRNAHMLVDKFLLTQDSFLGYSFSGITLLCRFFQAAFESNHTAAIDSLNKLILLPLQEIKNEFEEFIWLGSKLLVGSSVDNDDVRALLSSYPDNFKELMEHYFSDLFDYIYRSERDFQSGMLCLYDMLSEK